MLSQKTKYALKALLYLAQQKEGEIAKTIAISEGANIPKKFLEQILLDLKRAHFVGSKQGKLGGYYLLKSKDAITLADIHRLFDGAIALLPCASLNFYERCSDCADEATCHLRHGLISVREETLKSMQQITIASLVTQQ
ncbi:Putative HTH-type transcriptional regulator rrf2-like [Flavobacterium sp. 9R]|jgi:Rrf2 family protein|uniref:RrF2 family transcriptional regulator n=1 Tax=unclassified Flavobacterium TaxID=196869 RepID=UPI0012F2FE53|nr:Rrf2 family transcriptional regulator [Flavobacterium sp. 9R]VXB79791.1 Putative HTH-type transcriptional regulator rrf2-like [Flavobacterium sp. 9R]